MIVAQMMFRAGPDVLRIIFPASHIDSVHTAVSVMSLVHQTISELVER